MKSHLGWTLAAVAAFRGVGRSAEPTVLHIASHLTKPAKATLGHRQSRSLCWSTAQRLSRWSPVTRAERHRRRRLYHQTLDLKTAKLLH